MRESRAYQTGRSVCKKALSDMVGRSVKNKECSITTGMTDGGLFVQMTMDVSRVREGGVTSVLSAHASCVVNMSTYEVVPDSSRLQG